MSLGEGFQTVWGRVQGMGVGRAGGGVGTGK